MGLTFQHRGAGEMYSVWVSYVPSLTEAALYCESFSISPPPSKGDGQVFQVPSPHLYCDPLERYLRQGRDCHDYKCPSHPERLGSLWLFGAVS